LRSAGQGELAPFGLTEIHPEEGCQGLGKDGDVGTGIQEAVAEFRVRRAGQTDREDRA
jgi:hypothetical protein